MSNDKKPKVVVTVETDNAAFDDGYYLELWRIFSRVAMLFRDEAIVEDQSIRDSNGNTVGKIELKNDW